MNRKINVWVDGIRKSIAEDQLTLKENGDVEKRYKADMTLDTVAIAIDDEVESVKKIKELKDTNLDELIITHNTVAYDANGKSIGNMSAIVALASFKFNQYISIGIETFDLDGTSLGRTILTAAEAYDIVYKVTKIWWKGADNEPHEVMIESVCEVLELSMRDISDILGL